MSPHAKACARKVRHPDAWHARQAMNRRKESGNVVGTLAVYPCSHCKGWHFGHAGGAAVARAQRTISKIDAAVARDQAKRKGDPT